ncbi:hypothetical protein BBI17_008746 [Phytophthora kernoviae]|uniref:glucan endo-1,3-beta-D-glucosidase n=1 Tax=Phytophthora kernoviae TaxID=325452 RepID=A0A3R7FY49_9STRA|nr:hypothetical protein BBI17_008746 [Phytophthora kernoviae]
MVHVFLAVSGTLAVAAHVAVTMATSVSFVNDCAYDISLYDNNVTETIAGGSSTTRELADGFSGMFRNGTSAEATLAEFAISGGKAWYALSTVPPGAGNCTSYAECAVASGKTGYNVAMSITPNIGNTSANTECAAVTCESADCDGAYLYPTDNASISSSFVYSGTDAGSAAGTYGKVTEMSSCTTEDVSLTDPVGPFSEEVTMVFRGPMDIYNIGVFTGSSGSDWTKVSTYDSDAGTQDNMVFMNNMNIDYTGADSSPQGYSTSDGTSTATESTIFGGTLADASDVSVTGGGPCVSTGCEVNIMTATNCADEDGCIGYYDDMGFHGWDGGMKMFVTKVMMPTGSTANLPAIWMLNAQVVRASQYGCNCRGEGSEGGCGELDVAEVIETNTAQDKVSTHYYFYDGSVSPGGDNYASRPTDSAVTYVTIIDNSGTGMIKIIELGGDDFDFSVDSISSSTVSTWIDASVENLLS